MLLTANAMRNVSRLVVSLVCFWLCNAASGDEPNAPTPDTPVSAREEATGYTFLPTRSLFDPLIADVRWPRFSAEYQAYHKDPLLGNVGSANFGGTLPILQGPLPAEGRWDVGFQAAVFSIFDLDSQSHDLVNADYFFGLPISARWGWFSAMLRVYHQSSHLGDEFLLDHGDVQRINLSYEALDFFPSVDLWDWGRLYLGGGYLFDRDPSQLKRKYVQAGVELKSPLAFFGWLRPVAAADFKRNEEQDWATDYSVRAGFQFENEKVFKSRRLLLLGEYYKGFSPNGQFFDRRIEFFGVGVHFFF
ncbi:MAG TPA: DUF1207 domain-containing protein [Myxococcota bacterium]|nr:DUF1207 domain-containing protein [Myxococcota bacterium]